jgi:hypothetical protein
MTTLGCVVIPNIAEQEASIYTKTVASQGKGIRKEQVHETRGGGVETLWSN